MRDHDLGSNGLLLSSPAEGLADRNREAGEILQHAMQPLFAADRKGVPTSVASSVQLRLQRRQILVTADHSIKGAVSDRGFGLSLIVGDHAARPEAQASEAHLVPLPLAISHREHDIAIAYLDDVETDRLLPAPALFLSERNLLNRPLTDRRAYLVAGYPVGLQHRRIARETYTTQYYGLSVYEASPSTYAKHGFDGAKYLLLDFDQRRPIDGADGRRPPHPQGMSGGGVWAYGNVLDRVTHDNLPKLAGIVIEYREQPAPVLVAVRISTVLELAKRFAGS